MNYCNSCVLAHTANLVCKKMPSPNRKAVKTYLTPKEHGRVAAMAQQTGLSVSAFVKRVCLGQEIRTKTDQQTLLTLLKASADLGCLGGLLKMGLAEGKSGALTFEFRELLRQIEKSQALVAKDCREVANSLRMK